MEHRTKKVLFSALVGLGIGAIFTGLAIAYAVNIYGLLGLCGLMYGTVGTTACLVKGAFEYKSYREFMKRRDLDVSKSCDPQPTKDYSTEKFTVKTQEEQKSFIDELTEGVDLDQKAVHKPKVSKKTKLIECLEPSDETTQEK